MTVTFNSRQVTLMLRILAPDLAGITAVAGAMGEKWDVVEEVIHGEMQPTQKVLAYLGLYRDLTQRGERYSGRVE